MKISALFRRLLFWLLPFRLYLAVLSRMYFLYYYLGLLKNNKLYTYTYFLKNVIRPDDIVIDIGANLGYFTRLFAKWVGKNGEVYAVEPIMDIVAVLKRNVRKHQNVTILPYAIGSEDKDIELGNTARKRRGYISSGSHFVVEDHEQTGNVEIDLFPAKMKRGSQLFNDLRDLHFIKIDVEGYETIVLPELQEIIIRFHPMILVEARRENRTIVLSFMKDLGYVGFEFDNDEFVQVGRGTSGYEGDILFFHSSNIDRLPKNTKAAKHEINFPEIVKEENK